MHGVVNVQTLRAQDRRTEEFAGCFLPDLAERGLLTCEAEGDSFGCLRRAFGIDAERLIVFTKAGEADLIGREWSCAM